MACQSSPTSEGMMTYSEVGKVADADSADSQSLSQITLLSQQVQQVRQLQDQLRKELDSLYAIDTIPEIQNQIDTLESVYFALTDAETSWIVLRTQYADQFDSTSLSSDTIQDQGFESSLETVQRALSSSIKEAERSRFPSF